MKARNRLKWTLLAIGLIVFFEIIFGFALKFFPRKFNTQASSYYIYKNAPNYRWETLNKFDDNITDSLGFFHDLKGIGTKDSNTVRVFMCGGSAMMGSGQSKRYSIVKEYSSLIWSYDVSIAGYLKKVLVRAYPDKKIEVINAASNGRTLHMSMVQYLETISTLSPDIIINMDGFNDVPLITTGETFKFSEQLWHRIYMHIFVASELEFFSNTIEFFVKSMVFFSEFFLQGSPPSLKYNEDYYTYSKYESVRPKLKQNSKRFLSGLEHYTNILKADSVPFIFALQPILFSMVNKEFTENELGFKKLHPFDLQEYHPMYKSEHIWSLVNDAPTPFENEILASKFIWDDFLNAEMSKIIARKGFHFIDLNKEISKLDSRNEFYMDYCHLTKTANKFVANELAEVIMLKGLIK